MDPRIVLLASTLLIAHPEPACPNVVLNEIMPGPGTDWNGDGSFSSSEDEWVEIVNPGAEPADLAGYFLADGSGPETPRLGLSGTLAPGEHLFVTGEHAADWESENGFPAVGLSLNNSGDILYLFQAAGGTTTLVDSLAYSGGDVAPDVSLGRLPDGTGEFQPMDALTPSGSGPQPTPGGPNGGIASPKILAFDVAPGFPTSADSITIAALCADSDGIAESLLFVRVDGAGPDTSSMSLVDGAAPYGTWAFTIPPLPAGTALGITVQTSDGSLVSATNEETLIVAGADSPVVLNEILADPPADLAGDANGDGTRHTSQDEFVELFNRGASVVDLSGWTLHDATGLRHEFEAGRSLSPGSFFVIFGGGAPVGIPSGFTVASTGGLSLNNTSDEVRLVGPDGIARDTHAYGPEANADQSIIRLPDGHGDWTRPSDAGFAWSFSPGVANAAPTAVEEQSWARIKALYRE